MTQEEIDKLNSGDGVRRPSLSKDRFLAGLSDRGKIILRAPAGVWIRWEDDPHEEDQFYSFDDPYLAKFHFDGRFDHMESWLRPEPVKHRAGRPKGRTR
jgi:hypothetical protein